MSISAISTALGGMQAATGRLEKAAATIANAGSTSSSENAQSLSSSTQVSKGTLPQPLVTGEFVSGDITSAVIEAKQAEISYKASLNVVKVANEMFDALLDITS